MGKILSSDLISFSQVGITGVLGELFISFCQLGEEGEDFVWG
jgi:hypothetical protein